MPIKNAIHSQQVYDPTDESIMAEHELCMERLYDYNHTRPSEHAKREQLSARLLVPQAISTSPVPRTISRRSEAVLIFCFIAGSPILYLPK